MLAKIIMTRAFTYLATLAVIALTSGCASYAEHADNIEGRPSIYPGVRAYAKGVFGHDEDTVDEGDLLFIYIFFPWLLVDGLILTPALDTMLLPVDVVWIMLHKEPPQSAMKPAIPPDVVWRQTPTHKSDTIFPKIRLGMTQQQVRSLIPKLYQVVDNQQLILRQTPQLSQFATNKSDTIKFIRISRLLKQRRVIETDHFVFKNGKLIDAFGGYSGRLH
jgi:uncharacterized protein YceK